MRCEVWSTWFVDLTDSANSILQANVQLLAHAAGSVARSGLSTYSEAPPLTSYPNSTSIDQWYIPPDDFQKHDR
ncbi:hypothetical protein SDJN02_13175, partial [Cucurbita argyrosperma subsp. argyrosperma]